MCPSAVKFAQAGLKQDGESKLLLKELKVAKAGFSKEQAGKSAGKVRQALNNHQEISPRGS